MTDQEQIVALYREMYRHMIAKDTASLGRILADDFVLVHMTGMRQSKQEYLRAIANGTLNYYNEELETHPSGLYVSHNDGMSFEFVREQ